MIGAFLIEYGAGQALFTKVELSREGVILSSPFRRIALSRSDVISATLWIRSPQEEMRPAWNQAAILRITMAGGRRMDVGMLGVRLLREIESRLVPIDTRGKSA